MAQTQYRAKHFAKMCGISKQRVSELVAQGKLTGIHMGRDLIIDVRDPLNQKWIEDRMKKASGLESLVDQPFEEEDEDEDDCLTHEEAIILVNDCFDRAVSCVDCSALGETYIAPGVKAMISSDEQKKVVPQLIKAVRLHKSDAEAKDAVIKILRNAARKLLKDLAAETLYFRHYCMETEDRGNFTYNFKTDEWDAITRTSDEAAVAKAKALLSSPRGESAVVREKTKAPQMRQKES